MEGSTVELITGHPAGWTDDEMHKERPSTILRSPVPEQKKGPAGGDTAI